jgi:hypothetical protein
VSALQQVLGQFAGHVNGQASLKSTLAGWSPAFFIEAPDTGETFRVHFEGGQVRQVVPTEEEPGDSALLLRGDSALIERIFTGRLSPLGAYTDGQLEVYGSPKDQIKLDVIALVLWGA